MLTEKETLMIHYHWPRLFVKELLLLSYWQ